MCIYSNASTAVKNPSEIEINSVQNKKIIASFDGGLISSDAGALLLKAAGENVGIVGAMAHCIEDKRERSKIIHTVEDMLLQLIIQLGCGYEDLNDSASLRHDPVFRLLNDELLDSGKPLASAPTLCRFENGVKQGELLKIGEMFVRRFVDKYRENPPQWICIDLDATEDETYGQQEFSFYHGYYRGYCYLPMVVTACCDFNEEHEPIGAVLRPGNVHASYGTITLLKRIFRIVREAFPGVKFMIRGDCGFAMPEIYRWLESAPENEGKIVKYVIGIPRNARLSEKGEATSRYAGAIYEETAGKVRLFGEFSHQAKTWKRERRIIHKSEVTIQGVNNRFVITNIDNVSPEDVYDGLYVRRGQMENRIKELKNGLYMDRTSCSSFLGNQFRVFLTLATFLLFQEIRRNPAESELETAQVETLRLKLLKIGARVKETVRRIKISFASSFPLQNLFWDLLGRLRGGPVFAVG